MPIPNVHLPVVGFVVIVFVEIGAHHKGPFQDNILIDNAANSDNGICDASAFQD